jgi:uncharacterized membrane protein YqjE
MAIAAQTFVEPNFQVPGLKLSQSLKSDFWMVFGEGAENMKEQLSPITKAVYMRAAQFRTNAKLVATGGDSNRIPSGDVDIFPIQSPTTSILTNQEYNRATLMAFKEVAGLDYRALMQAVARQGINQVISTLALSGNGGTYEGILNAVGKITTSALLVSDSFGATELGAQAEVEIRDAIITDINLQLAALNLISSADAVTITVLTSQRVMQVLNSKIIPVLSGGAGLSWSIRKNIDEVFASQNKKVLWGVDDRQFKATGTSGTKYDKMLITIASMPNVSKGQYVNTNFVAAGVPNIINENNLMYASQFIPFEVPTVIENNGLRVLYEVSSITSGWNIQSNTVQVISDVKYEA